MKVEKKKEEGNREQEERHALIIPTRILLAVHFTHKTP